VAVGETVQLCGELSTGPNDALPRKGSQRLPFRRWQQVMSQIDVNAMSSDDGQFVAVLVVRELVGVNSGGSVRSCVGPRNLRVAFGRGCWVRQVHAQVNA